tara:strand:- start:35 stop:295 length:261 start_codon:yes stop_codon:yes gene_type:complete
MKMENDRQNRDNSGVLFKSDKRENERAPHYRGNITVDGKDYWISAWIKEGKSGKFMGLAVSPKEEYKPKPSERSKATGFDDESLPF